MTSQVYLQAGAFMYNPSYATRNGSFQLDNTGRTGSMYLAELGFTPEFGQNKLPGTWKIGVWRNTADANDVLKDSEGNDYVLSKHAPRIHDGRYGGWLYMQQQVTTQGDDRQRGFHFSGILPLMIAIPQQWITRRSLALSIKVCLANVPRISLGWG
jgi:porin